MSDDVDEAIAALHQGELDAFLEGRKALAAKLKKAGDKDGAARVAALAKPTPSAWATNRASATARDAFVDLLQIGVELRSTMRLALAGTPGQDVAALQRRQREVVEALLGEAKRLLADAKLPSSDVVTARVRTNLTTIGTTGKWGDAKSACLSKDLAPLDVAQLAALLEVEADEDRAPMAAPPRARAAEPAAAQPAAPDLAAERAAREAARRAREEKIRALEAELATAEAAHENRSAAEIELGQAAASLESAATDAARHADESAREVERLEALLVGARETSTQARRALEEASQKVALARRDRERAAQEAIRSKTHLLAVREKLDRAKQEPTS